MTYDRGMKRLHAIVVGRVQGVGFREFVRSEGAARGLTGYVSNGVEGGSVEVVAEGDEASLSDLIDVLHKGPRFARVDSVDFTFSDATRAFNRFSVEHM